MVAQVHTCVHVFLYCMYIYPRAVPSLNKNVTYLLTILVLVIKEVERVDSQHLLASHSPHY